MTTATARKVGKRAGRVIGSVVLVSLVVVFIYGTWWQVALAITLYGSAFMWCLSFLGRREVILMVLRRDPERVWFSLDLAKELSLLPGTMYAKLARLENEGLLDSDWSATDPRRRRYWLTEKGKSS